MQLLHFYSLVAPGAPPSFWCTLGGGGVINRKSKLLLLLLLLLAIVGSTNAKIPSSSRHFVLSTAKNTTKQNRNKTNTQGAAPQDESRNSFGHPHKCIHRPYKIAYPLYPLSACVLLRARPSWDNALMGLNARKRPRPQLQRQHNNATLKKLAV